MQGHSNSSSVCTGRVHELAVAGTQTETGRRDASEGRNWCARQGTGRQASCGAVTGAGGFGFGSVDSFAFFRCVQGRSPPGGRPGWDVHIRSAAPSVVGERELGRRVGGWGGVGRPGTGGGRGVVEPRPASAAALGECVPPRAVQAMGVPARTAEPQPLLLLVRCARRRRPVKLRPPPAQVSERARVRCRHHGTASVFCKLGSGSLWREP